MPDYFKIGVWVGALLLGAVFWTAVWMGVGRIVWGPS